MILFNLSANLLPDVGEIRKAVATVSSKRHARAAACLDWKKSLPHLHSAEAPRSLCSGWHPRYHQIAQDLK
jgi:hypothetical protein